MKSKLLLGLLIWGSSLAGFAQTTKSEAVFGSVLERKVQKDTTKKRRSYNLLKPAFLRIGLMGGGLIGFKNNTNENIGGSIGLRIEYGISNRWSLSSEIQVNRFEGTPFLGGQSALGINWMPIKSRRLQPFFGLGVGIGRNEFKASRYGKNSPDGDDNLFDIHENNRAIRGFAFARTGVNYVLFTNVIAIAETAYQLPFNQSNATGGLSLRLGAAYQFGKRMIH